MKQKYVAMLCCLTYNNLTSIIQPITIVTTKHGTVILNIALFRSFLLKHPYSACTFTYNSEYNNKV